MSKDNESEKEPITIKKYANRRLYNTDTSTYVTLDDLAEMVRQECDFLVHDAKSGADLTHSVLTQIIVDQESKGQNLLPIRFLRQLIRFYGNSIERLVPSYLELSLDQLTTEQDKFHDQLSGAFNMPTLEAMQEQARQNFVMFEHTLNMFSPFAPSEAGTEAAQTEKKPCAKDKKSAEKKVSEDEIQTLKTQLSDMQEKLEKLSK